MLAGAVLGAFLAFRMGLLALTFSAGLAALLASASLWVPRPWQRGYMPR
jgi:uncharacterized membrane protein YoaK (UPF0700 family)